MSHQTQKPMTPHQFLHFGVPEPVEVRYQRETERYEADLAKLG